MDLFNNGRLELIIDAILNAEKSAAEADNTESYCIPFYSKLTVKINPSLPE